MEDMNWDFAGEDDFGLASSFSNAPLGMISPVIDNDNHQNEYTTEQLGKNQLFESENALGGLNFKMAPGVDVSRSVQ